MASKSTIINVVVETKFNTAYVYYSTGTEKMYPADKMPKTVAKWLEEHETVDAITSVHANDDGSLVAHYSTGTVKAFESIDDLPKEIRSWLNANGVTYNAAAEAVEEEPETAEDVAQLPALVDLPVIDTATGEVVSMETPQTHREPPRRPQASQVKSLPLDIVEAVVSGILMASRLSLIALAYLLMGLASTCQAIGEAVEWMTPRAASLIDRSRAAWSDRIVPAGKAAAVWMAEAVWYVLI